MIRLCVDVWCDKRGRPHYRYKDVPAACVPPVEEEHDWLILCEDEETEPETFRGTRALADERMTIYALNFVCHLYRRVDSR